MTLSYSVLAASFLATYVVYLLARSIFRALRRRRLAKIHGCRPPPQLPSPFFGIPAFFDLVRAAKRKQVVQHIEKIVARCGTTFERTILGYSQIATIDPENIKAMLATQFNDFALGTRHEIFYPLLGDGIFTLDGAGWSHSRALLRPQFTRDQVADIGMLSSHVDHFLAALPKDRTAFDIQELLFRLTLDSATEFLFGESTHSLSPNFVAGSGPLANCGGEEGFAHAFNLAQEYLVDRGRAQALYWLINPPKFRQAVKLVHEVVDYYVDQAIKKSQQLEKKDSSGSDNKRYVFLEAVARDTQDRKVLRDQMLNILLAGRDTTASLLSSSFFYLARHPRVWTRLREEIIRAFPPTESADTITIERLREVKYLRYFLNEVLRLLPPVSANTRWATVDTTLPRGGGPDGQSPIFVEKGKRVAYFVSLMHRRKDIWGPDANEFRPERWEENAKRGWEYLPFNGGPRICLGQQYALTEASYVLVRLLQRFDTLENAQPEMVEPVIKFNLTISHDEGVRIRLYNSKEVESGSHG